MSNAADNMPSDDPLEIARRLKGYIAGTHHSAKGDCEAPPEGLKSIRPHMQRRFMTESLNHVKRLEYMLRCFILFLTAQLIALGQFTPHKPRAARNAADKSLAQREDEALRDQLRDLPRLPTFTVLTPVIEARGRKIRRSARHYAFLPDRLQLVDAGHLFARLKLLSHVLEHADRFALNLARRVVVPQPPIAVKTGIYASEFSDGPLEDLRHGHPTARVSRAPALSTAHREYGAAARGENQIPNPLNFAPLAHFCPPEALWASALDRGEQQDVNTLHYLASAKLEDIGYGIRPDPYAGLPDLSCLWSAP
ncbi:hypothetical protein [Ponticaulis sp.]|uniref:hypothetical protein n=1 Tax=Ponticaulis sp. TaxID=2020902 RepID=UPI000B6A9196|nr:hypothetical protein [Ponticaulis sp.]MAI90713.1 hypothetical protein [Ponticaulis sp.]OUX98946.1 MAG: hypothetical protein CBB65_09755 [Hyphomonadaceae bacterium TMED5]|tara:strand:- start:32 stop:958 length:927 start_codon:yes stop_codon:yes gene_type:complete